MSRAIVCDIINTDYQSARIQFKAVSVNVAKIQEGWDGWITAGSFIWSISAAFGLGAIMQANAWIFEIAGSYAHLTLPTKENVDLAVYVVAAQQ